MLCLRCGHNNDYKEPVCSGCQVKFELVAPFYHPTHVSQMFSTTQAFLEGKATEQELTTCYDAFVELFSDLDSKWRLSQLTLGERTAEPLRRHFGAGLSELDQASEILLESLEGFEHFFDEGDVKVLEQANDRLLDFYMTCCAACARLKQALRKLEQDDQALGSFLDIRSR